LPALSRPRRRTEYSGRGGLNWGIERMEGDGRRTLFACGVEIERLS
jgi:hypothetical protein